MDLIDKNKMINTTLNKLVKEYSRANLDITQHIPRMIFEVNLVLKISDNFKKIIDLGGGISIFPILLKCFYKTVIVVDDLSDHSKLDDWQKFTLKKMISSDVKIIKSNLDDLENLNIDFNETSTICTFNFIEHLHNSPRRLLTKILKESNYNSNICIATPNSNNLRKRFSAIIGNYSWSNFEQYWNEYPFRGHVREPSLKDLNKIVEKLGYTEFRNFGRNWLGIHNNNKLIRILTRIINPLLKLYPSLCSDIYVIAKKNKFFKN